MRSFLPTLALLAAAGACGSPPRPKRAAADLIVVDAKVVTVDPQRPSATAFAVKDGKFIAVGESADVLVHRGEKTRVVDAGGRTVIPGLNDSHAHVVRGGRFYNLELRWDGVGSLERGLEMVREQAERTPPGQWVRVVGGWSPYQFTERRMPTIRELNDAAPETPAFVLFLYSRGFLNRAGVRALGLDESSKSPPGGRYELVDGGAVLHADPDPTILYQTIARLPQLSAEDQVNSTLHFNRELNRLGITSAIDAGGGGHAFPSDYGGSQTVVRAGKSSIRISYFLFPQSAGKEADDFRRWTSERVAGRNEDTHLEHGFELEGGGETLAHSVGDWENFLSARPDLEARRAQGTDPQDDLREVASMLVKKQWPFRIHATYGESVRLILDVLEHVKAEHGRLVPRWVIDHAETVGEDELRRIRAMGGGIAIQDRMAFAGESFLERYGAAAAAHAPPIRRMLDLGIPVAAGTDATRVSSFNPWLALSWLVSGKSVGGTPLLDASNRLSREKALELFTVGSAWLSQEEAVKGRIAPEQFADFVVLSEDYLGVPEERIRDIRAMLTVVGGEIVYAADEFEAVAPATLPAVSPPWSPVARFGGYQHMLR